MRDGGVIVLEKILRQSVSGCSFSSDLGHPAHTDFRVRPLAPEKEVILEAELAGRKLCTNQLVRSAPCWIASVCGMYRPASNQCNAAEKGKKFPQQAAPTDPRG